MSYEFAIEHYTRMIQLNSEYLARGDKVEHHKRCIQACKKLLMREMLECGVVEEEVSGVRLVIEDNELFMEKI